jgi:protein TonB
VSDAVDRVLADRQALDRGLGSSLALSSGVHVLFLLLAFLGPLLLPAAPPLRVQTGFVVPMPAGGGGSPDANPAPAPAPTQPPSEPEPPPPPKPEPPAKILKPPKEPPKKGLPDPSTSKKGKPTPSPSSRASRGGVVGGTGTSSQPFGLEMLPPGPGVPGGTDAFGDWYLAGVQRKIWMLWTQQVRDANSREIVVSFTIAADGSVADVQVTQPSGVFLLDQAAQRAVLNAAPFGPLPKDYGTNRITIRAIFRPTS